MVYNIYSVPPTIPIYVKKEQNCPLDDTIILLKLKTVPHIIPFCPFNLTVF